MDKEVITISIPKIKINGIESINNKINEFYEDFNQGYFIDGRIPKTEKAQYALLDRIIKYKILIEPYFEEHTGCQLKDIIYSISSFRYCKDNYRTYLKTIESMAKLNNMEWLIKNEWDSL